MAKINNGIFGPVSGKIGPIIGSSWKGIPYIKEASKTSYKEKVRTPAQIANEARFKFINNWLVPFHPYFTIGFQNLAIRKTAISAALSANYNAAFSGTYPDISIAWDQLVISSGTLAPLANIQAAFSSADTIELIWQQNYRPGASYSDQVMLVLYAESLKLTDGFLGAANRAAEQHRFSINPRFAGQVLHAYISVISLDRKGIADSMYLGKLSPL